MPNLPLKRLGRAGVIKDIAPYNLPLNAWSDAQNVRFENGRVRRAPSFRFVSAAQDAPGFLYDPEFMFTVRPPNGNDTVIYAAQDGSLATFRGAHTDRTHISFTPATNDEPFTGTYLDNTAYVNRSTAVPYSWVEGDTTFSPLSDFGFDAADRCGVIRAFRDHLIFLDNTIGGVEKPTTVRWSDVVDGSGGPPTDYDVTSTTNSAGIAPLPDVEGRLIEGQPLKNVFLIYTQSEVWRMIPTNDDFIFEFERAFDDDGCIGYNCAASVGGLQYVFGSKDIYVTDGFTKRSITQDDDGNSLVRDYIYSSMNRDNINRFKVSVDTRLNEVHFMYTSADNPYFGDMVRFPNKSAVYNYRNRTWSFRDIPNISGWGEISLTTSNILWSQQEGSWNNAGGTWGDGSTGDLVVLYTSKPDSNGVNLPTVGTLYAYDLIGPGSVLNEQIDTSVTPPAIVERVGLDLDEIGQEIRQYNLVTDFYPQAQAFSGTTFNFYFGGSLFADANAAYGTPVVFDPATETAVSVREGGRYLSMKLVVNDTTDFYFSGGELNVVSQGRRS